MKFLIVAQLPPLMAEVLNDLGHQATHVMDKVKAAEAAARDFPTLPRLRRGCPSR